MEIVKVVSLHVQEISEWNTTIQASGYLFPSFLLRMFQLQQYDELNELYSTIICWEIDAEMRIK